MSPIRQSSVQRIETAPAGLVVSAGHLDDRDPLVRSTGRRGACTYGVTHTVRMRSQLAGSKPTGVAEAPVGSGRSYPVQSSSTSVRDQAAAGAHQAAGARTTEAAPTWQGRPWRDGPLRTRFPGWGGMRPRDTRSRSPPPAAHPRCCWSGCFPPRAASKASIFGAGKASLAGQTWRLLSDPCEGLIPTGVAAVAGGPWYLYCQLDSGLNQGTNQIFKSGDEGGSWQLTGAGTVDPEGVTVGNIGDDIDYDLTISNNGRVLWLVGTVFSVLTSSDGGRHWSVDPDRSRLGPTEPCDQTTETGQSDAPRRKAVISHAGSQSGRPPGPSWSL